MKRIFNILKLDYLVDGEITYICMLRNEKKFNLLDDVFIAPLLSPQIFRARIIGIEIDMPEHGNKNYLYKLRITRDVIDGNQDCIKEGATDYTLTCDNIFKSIAEAKESAIKSLDQKAKLQRDAIERYFNQFE